MTKLTKARKVAIYRNAAKDGGSEEVQNRRVLALCFMAALAEAGDL